MRLSVLCTVFLVQTWHIIPSWAITVSFCDRYVLAKTVYKTVIYWNVDVYELEEYAFRFNERNKHINGLKCSGQWGVMQVCEYKVMEDGCAF